MHIINGLLTCDTKNILCMEDSVLTYESLTTGPMNVIYWIQHEVLKDDFVVKMDRLPSVF